MLSGLQTAWQRSDRLFSLLRDDAWLEQPIPLRQPFVFYLGHLPAFAWNHVGRGLLGQPVSGEFDSLFERGIDPVDADTYSPRASWPDVDAVVEYRDRVRRFVTDAASDPHFPAEGQAVLLMVLEHELMHHETLLYMVQELRHELKRRRGDWAALPPPLSTPGPARTIEIPEGDSVLGARPGSLAFGWDNEFPEHRVHIDAFQIDDRPVTNADFLEFVRDGGYHDARLWREADWAWRSRRGVEHPHGWIHDGSSYRCRTLLEDAPFETAAHWPAMTSWAEAAAYARWRHARLPTEAEWHRAACGEDGRHRGAHALKGANLGFHRASALPVSSHAANGWGVHELVGNGWEWTSTEFGPFPGFKPMPRYPGYSADFFDGRHFVVRGASWATDARLARPSFRNWFQPHYPYVFSKFRCVSS